MSGPNLAPVLALEIGPMVERHHTGIPNVTKQLAIEMARDASIEAQFFIGRKVIPKAIVTALCNEERGEILEWCAGHVSEPSSAHFEFEGRPLIGIYPGTKGARRLYPFEVLIVHDLTTIILPQFHSSETNTHTNAHWRGDLGTSDLIVAISQATLHDIQTYFPECRHIPKMVSYLAPSRRVPGPPAVNAPNARSRIVVLGTFEPRKNAAIVLEALALTPSILEDADIVFVGRHGWGDELQDLCNAFGLQSAFVTGRISSPGFVSDRARDQILAGAKCLIYPSRYEGFGLPVIEALSLGVPVIASWSSSLPEAGGDLAQYFDPGSPVELARLVQRCLAEGANHEDAHRRKDWAAQFSWDSFYNRIKWAALDGWNAQNSA